MYPQKQFHNNHDNNNHNYDNYLSQTPSPPLSTPTSPNDDSVKRRKNGFENSLPFKNSSFDFTTYFPPSSTSEPTCQIFQSNDPNPNPNNSRLSIKMLLSEPIQDLSYSERN